MKLYKNEERVSTSAIHTSKKINISPSSLPQFGMGVLADSVVYMALENNL